MKRKKKESRKGIFMMIFIAFIMITSVIGFLWKGGPPQVEYNGVLFTQETWGWSAKINGQNMAFNYHPQEIEYINMTPSIPQRLNTVEIDTTYDINDSYAEHIAKVQYALETGLINFNIFVVKGFTTENEFNKPIITCDNATPYVPVVYFKKSNKTEILLEGNCIIVEANRENDLLKIKDKLIYSILGIIK